MKRIAIMGNAGSGKSYLARRLGAIHDIPVVDLDDLFWLQPGDYTRKRPLDQLTAMVDAEQGREAWVVEGVYGELVEPFLRTAQLLVWLDLPWSICLARLNGRHADRGLAADSESFGALIAYAAAYWQRNDMRSHEAHGHLFEGFSGHKHRWTTEDEVNAFLATHAPGGQASDLRQEPTPSDMPAIIGLDHVQLAMPRGEEPQARAFYGGVLGLVEEPKPANLAARGGVWFRGGSLRLHLGVDAGFRAARKAHPAFLVRDLPGLAERCRAAGYPPATDEPLEGFNRIYVSDPFGNRIELLEPIGPSES